MNQRLTKIKVIVGSAFVLLFQSCLPSAEHIVYQEETSFPSSSNSCESAERLVKGCHDDLLQSYSQSFHKVFTQICASCHAGGPGKGAFASSDINESFDWFSKMGIEALSAQALNANHQPGFTGPQNASAIQQATALWNGKEDLFGSCVAEAEKTCSATGSKFSFSPECNSSPSIADLTEQPLRRLVKEEILASYRDLFYDGLFTGQNLKTSTQLLTDETFENSLADFAPNLSVRALLGLAEAVTTEVATKGFVEVRNNMGCDGTDAKCLQWYLNFSERAYKRPLSSAEKQNLTSFYSQLGLITAMQRVLVSPEFSTHFLVGNDTQATRKLDAFEVAHRVSFQTSGGLPDNELWTAAKENRLTTLAQIRPHVQRMLRTQKASEKIQRTVRAWLGLSTAPDPAQAIANFYSIDRNGYGHEAQQEFDRFVHHIVYNKNGTFEDLIKDKTVFASSPRLAINAGLPQSNQPQLFNDFRGGVLLRPASLLGPSAMPSIVSRGIALRFNVLCDSLGPPPDDFTEQAEEVAEAMSHEMFTSREILTEQTRGSCMACHSALNPLGYALEGFDAFGMPRSKELFLSASGGVIAEHTVNTWVDDLRIDDEAGLKQPAKNPDDLVGHISGSAKAMKCLSKTLHEGATHVSMGRYEKCQSETMAKALHENKPVLKAIEDTVLNESIFYVRK